MDELFTKLEEYGADIEGIKGRFLGDKELYKNCFNTFLSDKSFAGLGESLKSKDYQKAFEYAHTLKGITGNMGITPLYEVVCTLVEKLRAKEYSKLEQDYEQIMKWFEKLKTLQ
ncbi:MAG: Hpt domain-containing protein [Oscillospiraceae bacterium]